MIIDEHKNGEAAVRIHDDFLTGIKESIRILEISNDNLIRSLTVNNTAVPPDSYVLRQKAHKKL